MPTATAKHQLTKAEAAGVLLEMFGRAGITRSSYIGLAKTHLQQVVTAVAMNLVWLWNW
jgi:hypothetical protein